MTATPHDRYTHGHHDSVLDSHRWLEIYHAVAWANGAEPDAGRRLLAWARADPTFEGG